MRRTMLLLAGVLLAAVALGSDSPKEYDDTTVADPLEGTWRLTQVEFNGTKVYMDTEVQTQANFRSGTYKYNSRTGGRTSDTFRASYRIDPTRKPPNLDLIPSDGPNSGQPWMLIYQIDEDSLRIAHTFRSVDLRRPLGFQDDNLVIKTYKRVKK